MKKEIINECIVKIFKYEEENNQIIEHEDLNAVQIKLDINNPIILLDKISKEDIEKYIGKCEYRFRKGVGYKGEIYRISFKEKTKNGNIIFYRYKKEKNKLKLDKNSFLEIKSNELKYIYPLVLSPEITDEGLKWEKNYIIFPYEYGERQPVPRNKLKNEAPNLYNYLFANQKEIIDQSRYNKRIQKLNEFYGLIRVGFYTYSKYFVAIRDNTKLTSCLVEWLVTDWGEKKNPIFDNHVSYVNLTSKKEAYYLSNKLKEAKLKVLTNLLFDNRSIGCRLPFKIYKYNKNNKEDKYEY